ncbi:MAG: rhomboid family intramembrane serine protease [Firmicutes bacterium]|nr:rhomboid family intramembrane serine protease [Bacillota bacterium]
MNWLSKIERKFGHLAVKRLMHYIIIFNVLVLLLFYFYPPILHALILVPRLVLKGELWRLVTYIFIPPTFSPLWVIFTLYFYYLVGTGLENEWGAFKFNIYYLTGMIGTTTGAFITGGGATALYLNLSLFFAFARIYPNFEILIFFILPVKIKYLAWLNWFFFGYNILFSTSLSAKIAALIAIGNYFLFFGKDTIEALKLKRQVYYNRKKFFDEIANTPPIHKCAVCGITEKDDPRMDFSYCKECGDDYEYCAKHINDHHHQKQNH